MPRPFCSARGRLWPITSISPFGARPLLVDADMPSKSETWRLTRSSHRPENRSLIFHGSGQVVYRHHRHCFDADNEGALVDEEVRAVVQAQQERCRRRGGDLRGGAASDDALADPTVFRSGRDFAAWIGLVPRQDLTGGKQKLGAISKQGDRYFAGLTRDPQLDFGQFWPGSSAARDSEHRIVFDDLMSAVEHEFHAAEISEGRPPALDV